MFKSHIEREREVFSNIYWQFSLLQYFSPAFATHFEARSFEDLAGAAANEAAEVLQGNVYPFLGPFVEG